MAGGEREGGLVKGMMTGAEMISRTLWRYGPRSVFSVAGGSHAQLLAAMQDDGWRIVPHRHEAGAVCAADGYSRVTQTPGVAVVIADQGLPNAITGIASAFHACSPVVVLVIRLPDSWQEAQAESEQSGQALVHSIVKDVRSVPGPERLGEYVDAAARRCLSGRPGPVVVSLPMEFLATEVAQIEAHPGALPPPPAPDAGVIAAAAAALFAAERPLMIAGAGAARSGAGDALQKLSATHRIPVAGNGLGRGLVPEDDVLGFSWPYAQIAASEADVVMLVGARLKQRLNYGLPPRFSKGARFIQIDLHAEEFHRNRPIEFPIHSDATLALEAMLAVDPTPRVDPSRIDWLHAALEPRRTRLAELQAIDSSPMHPAAASQAIADAMPPSAAVVGDGANAQNWLYGSVRIGRAPGFFDHYPLGSMGIGTPLAVGVAAGMSDRGDDRPVILVTGDGSLGFYAADLHAAVLAGLSLPVVVINDAAWGTEYHSQQGTLGRAVNTELGPQDWEHLAAVFGAKGVKVDTAGDLRHSLEQAIEAGGVTVINAIVDPQAGALLKQDRLVSTIVFDDLASNRLE